MTSGYSYVRPETTASASPSCTIMRPKTFGSLIPAEAFAHPRRGGADDLGRLALGEPPPRGRGFGPVDDRAPDAAAGAEARRQLLAVFLQVNLLPRHAAL